MEWKLEYFGRSSMSHAACRSAMASCDLLVSDSIGSKAFRKRMSVSRECESAWGVETWDYLDKSYRSHGGNCEDGAEAKFQLAIRLAATHSGMAGKSAGSVRARGGVRRELTFWSRRELRCVR